MIFIDHLPDNPLRLITLQSFGFCDAAEVFVLLAGVSAMMAYGKLFARDGAAAALSRIALRCVRIYAYQAALLASTLGAVRLWTGYFGLKPLIVAPLLDAGLLGLAHGLMLLALPGYLDILPLYIVLLALFPLVYLLMRVRVWLGLTISLLVWLAANFDHRLTLPNLMDAEGWYFNPFTWQLLFCIGVALAIALAACDGLLPRRRWLTVICCGYLGFAFLQTMPWQDWGLPTWRPLNMPLPDKRLLSPLRLLDILALFYLLFCSPLIRRLAQHSLARAFEACGKHSLEVFALGCLLSLFGRLTLRTWGHDLGLRLSLDAIGLTAMCLMGIWLERPRSGQSDTMHGHSMIRRT